MSEGTWIIEPAAAAAAPGDDPQAARRRRRRALRSWWWRSRPWLAAALAFLLVLLLLPQFFPADPAPGEPVVVARHDLPAGTVLAAEDVTIARLPSQVLPASHLREVSLAVGQRLQHPVAAGVPVVSGVLAGSGWGLGAGELAVPVRLADPLVAQLLQVGDVVRLVRVDGETAASLTPSARVLARFDSEGGGSLIDPMSRESPLLLVAVPENAATLVLDSSARGTLAVALGATSGPGSGTRES